MDFHSLSRKELQFLSKRNGVPANITNVAMADALRALEKVDGLDELNDPQQLPPPMQPRSSVKASARRSVAAGDEDLLGSVSAVSTQQRMVTRRSRKVVQEDDAEKKGSAAIPIAEFLPQTPAPRVPRLSISKAAENQEARGGLMSFQVTPSRRASLRVRSQTEKGDAIQEANQVTETPFAVKEKVGEEKVGRTGMRSGYRTRNSLGLRVVADEEAVVVATVEKSRRRSIRPNVAVKDSSVPVQEENHESVVEVLEHSEGNCGTDLTTLLDETIADSVPVPATEADAAPSHSPPIGEETEGGHKDVVESPTVDALGEAICETLVIGSTDVEADAAPSDTLIGEEIVGVDSDVVQSPIVEENGETLVIESTGDVDHQEEKIEVGELSNGTGAASANDVDTVISANDNSIITSESAEDFGDVDGNTEILAGLSDLKNDELAEEFTSAVMEITTQSAEEEEAADASASAVMEITSESAEEEEAADASEIIVVPSLVASDVPMEIASVNAEQVTQTEAPPAMWQNLLGSFTILDEGSAAAPPVATTTPAKSPAVAGRAVSAKKSGVKSSVKNRGVLTDAGKENPLVVRFAAINVNGEAGEKMLEKEKKKGLNMELENMSMRKLMGLYKKLAAKQTADDSSDDTNNNKKKNAEEESNKRFVLSPLNRNCLRAPLQQKH